MQLVLHAEGLKKIFVSVLHFVIYIQDVTGGTDQTSGGCSLC